jgi:hypothetical protein
MAKKNLLDELIRCRKDGHLKEDIVGDPTLKWCKICGALLFYNPETGYLEREERPLITQELDSRNGE